MRFWAFVFWASVLAARPLAAQERLLRVMGEECPRVFFFRMSEGLASNPKVSYEDWERNFSRLMGVMGKVLDEEVPGRSVRNIEFFTRFKKAHPDQVVLMHYNGNSRDPRWEAQRFFAGHWVYFNGATLTRDLSAVPGTAQAGLPAEPGESDIHVSDASLFEINMGLYKSSKDDIGLCLLDSQGKPNWHECEQVQLVSVDREKNVIRVQRGCYGTPPRAFPAGKSYAAAHCSEGPWGKKSNLLWFYNYSTRCPRDQQGRTCSDIHVAHLGELFSERGALAAFDGFEFDVLHNHCGRVGGRRAPDCDADGKADAGVFDGVNEYGRGVVEFCRKLRARLGDKRIIQADGGAASAQRAFGLLNGIESEGWPWLGDMAVSDWSGGLNRHFFWDRHARPPVFNYINHKFTVPGDSPGEHKTPDVPFNIHRLVFAAGMFTNSAICYSYAPKKDADGLFGVWDELRMGEAHQLGWLGKPVGPAVRLALREPNLLSGDLLKRLSSLDASFEMDKGALKMAAKDAQAAEFRVRLHDVPCTGPDLFVSLTSRGELVRNPTARLLHAGIAPAEGHFVRPDLPVTGMAARGKPETAIETGSGATVAYQPAVAIGGEKHESYFVHPPWRGEGKGYTFWQRTVRVPKDATLDFYTAMSERAPGRSDGIVFIVQMAEEGGQFEEIYRTTQIAHEWKHHTVSLARWTGKAARLKFIADCGPKDDTTTDQGYWGDVRVLGPGQDEKAATKPVRFMTWVNDKDFTSGFYFSDIRSSQVDLEFIMESAEPVWLKELAAYAHPDAMYREFERGLVVANPSPRPYTFDLERLFPGKRFRRLKGTANQDTQTNDGSAVGSRLTLEPKDALFLVREQSPL